MPSPVSSGPSSFGTNIGSGSMRSESTNAMMSPVVAAIDRHSTSPLPGTGGRLGHCFFAADRARAGGTRADLGVVGGARIEHHQLVDETAQQRMDRVDDLPDGLLLVEGGQHHRDGAAGLRALEFGDRPRRDGPNCSASLQMRVGALMPVPSRCVQAGGSRRSMPPCRPRDGSLRPRVLGTSSRLLPRPMRSLPMCPPTVRSSSTPRVSPTKSLLLSAISTGHPVFTRTSTCRNNSSPW